MEDFIERMRKNANPLFWISTTIMVAMMIYPPTSEWFWTVLPFVCTFYVQKMDWI